MTDIARFALDVLLAGMCARRRWIGRRILGCAVGREFAPAGDLLFFVSPKKRRQKKGDPTCRVPSLRYGQPAMLGRLAVLRNSLCSLRSRRSDSRSKSEHEAWASSGAHTRPTPCASRHGQRGPKTHTGHRCARPQIPGRAKRRPVRFPHPSGCAEERSGRGERVRRRTHPHRDLTRCGCLNGATQSRSEFRSAPRSRAPQVARSEAQGRSVWGRLFFAFFLLATQKKEGRPPGRTPGIQRHQPHER